MQDYQRDEHRVHLIVYHLIWCPRDRVADIVKEWKGVTSRVLRQEFPHLRKLPSMWTRSYLASLTQPSQAAIDLFVDAQKGLR